MDNSKWYVLKCKKGDEESVMERIKSSFDLYQCQKELKDIKIIKKRIRTKQGKEKMKIIYPGYIYISLDLNNKTWFLVRNVKGIYGFLGSVAKNSKPVPLSKKEVNFLKYEEEEYKKNNVLYDTDIELEQLVKIKEHNLFKNQIGTIKAIDLNKGIFEIEVVFMGKKHKINEEFKNIEKI